MTINTHFTCNKLVQICVVFTRGIYATARSWGEIDTRTASRSAKTATHDRCAAAPYRGIAGHSKDKGGFYWGNGWSNTYLAILVDTWLKWQRLGFLLFSACCCLVDVPGEQLQRSTLYRGHLAHHHRTAAQRLRLGS